MNMIESNSTIKLIIYDGVCGFCDRWVQFILDNQPHKDIRFIAFQSEKAKPFLEQYQITDMNAIIFIENDVCYTQSTAILKILNYLDSKWKNLYYLIYIPVGIRNLVYHLISKNRYVLMGKNASCRIPTHHEKSLFIDK